MTQIALLNVDGVIVPHIICMPMLGDGACLFGSISFVLYGNWHLAFKVREQIISYIVGKWEEFHIMSHDNTGNNYENSDA